MNQNKETIQVLNDLIMINNDRIAGYEKAVTNLDPSDARLKSLFYRMADESHDCKRELAEKVAALGGDPAEAKTTAAGKVYRVWMDIKANFSGDDTKSTLEACEFGEDAAQRAYKEALKASDEFPEEVTQLIQNQKNLLKMSHDLVRNQRDQLKEVEK